MLCCWRRQLPLPSPVSIASEEGAERATLSDAPHHRAVTGFELVDGRRQVHIEHRCNFIDRMGSTAV